MAIIALKIKRLKNAFSPQSLTNRAPISEKTPNQIEWLHANFMHYSILTRPKNLKSKIPQLKKIKSICKYPSQLVETANASLQYRINETDVFKAMCRKLVHGQPAKYYKLEPKTHIRWLMTKYKISDLFKNGLFYH